MEQLIYFLADVVLSGAILWIAALATGVDLDPKEAVIVVLASSVVGLVPTIGWILAIIVFFYLLKKYTDDDVWPYLILLVVVSKVFTILLLILLGLAA